MKRITLLICTLLALSGCASSGLTQDQVAALIAQDAKRQTLTIDCPAGCKVAYRDPRDRLQLPKNTNGWDFANGLVSTLGNVAMTATPWVAVAGIAHDGFKAAGDRNSNNTRTTDRHDVTTDRHDVTDSTHAPTVVTQPPPLVVPQNTGE